MPKEPLTYTQQVFAAALAYSNDQYQGGYDRALSACRDIARNCQRQSETVYADFEIACDEIEENDE